MPHSLPHKEPGRSILVLTDNEQGARPLVDALAREDFTVRVRERRISASDGYTPKGADLLIVDSGRFSLEELSTFPRIRSVYTGLLMLLIDDIDEMLQVLLYEQGVDDLLVKPDRKSVV